MVILGDYDLLRDCPYEVIDLLDEYLESDTDDEQGTLAHYLRDNYNGQLICIVVDNFHPLKIEAEPAKTLMTERIITKSFDISLRCDSGKLVVIDAGTLINEEVFQESNSLTIDSPTKVLDITIQQIGFDPDSLALVGLFNKHTPNIALRYRDSEQSERDYLPLIRMEGILTPALLKAPQKQCYGKIRKVYSDHITVDLMMSPYWSSGYGRFPVTDSDIEFSPNEFVLLRLKEYTGNFWKCEFLRRETP